MDFSSTASISIGWHDLLDIALVTFLFYNIIIMVKKTRAAAALYGLVLIILAYFISSWLGLITLNMLLENVLRSLFLIVIIVFQRDIRQALTSIGSRQWGLFSLFQKKKTEPAIEILCEAALYMAQRKIGALIILEREMPLGDTMDRGVWLDADISRELLIAIFWPNNPLHDGAAVLRGGRVLAAGCILPLSTAVTKRDYGTRHRAAIGLTEETDAIAIVVSEERGVVSIGKSGELTEALDAVQLPKALTALLKEKI